MALADKINKIAQEQEQEKQEFLAVFGQGLARINELKTRQEKTVTDQRTTYEGGRRITTAENKFGNVVQTQTEERPQMLYDKETGDEVEAVIRDGNLVSTQTGEAIGNGYVDSSEYNQIKKEKEYQNKIAIQRIKSNADIEEAKLKFSENETKRIAKELKPQKDKIIGIEEELISVDVLIGTLERLAESGEINNDEEDQLVRAKAEKAEMENMLQREINKYTAMSNELMGVEEPETKDAVEAKPEEEKARNINQITEKEQKLIDKVHTQIKRLETYKSGKGNPKAGEAYEKSVAMFTNRIDKAIVELYKETTGETMEVDDWRRYTTEQQNIIMENLGV